MRPTGSLHLGNYHGALKNWTELQYQYDCYFFIADYHALTTGYEDTRQLEDYAWQMVIDWLAAGLNPAVCTMFIQSRVPEHAELHLLLSMITPLGWLERVPTYKDQQEQLKEKDLATYGFLGYPLLQSADILLYRPMYVPVGEDQVAHVEITREIARRFNFVFGREPDFEAKAERAIKNLGSKNAAIYRDLRKSYQEQGNEDALDEGARAARRQFAPDAGRPRAPARLPRRHRPHDPDRTGGAADVDAEGHGSRRPQDVEVVRQHDRHCARIRTRSRRSSRRCRPIPARVRRTDPGDPEKCPVWDLHKLYSDDETQRWVDAGLPHGRHRLSRMQEAGDRHASSRRSPACASGRRNTRRIPTSCAASSPRAARRRARSPARRSTTSSRPWA